MKLGWRELKLSLLFFLGISALEAKESICTEPDIKGDNIVFIQGGNLWLGKIEKNRVRATPLIKDKGDISYPKFSKNGEKLAFVGKVGFLPNWDLFSVGLDGDNLERHTYTGINTSPCSWLTDSKIAYQAFSKNISREKTLAMVELDNQKTKEDYLGVEQSAEPFFSINGEFFFTRFSPQSVIEAYRGGQLRQIYKGVYPQENFGLEKITLFEEANCFNPMVIGNRLYFLSDISGRSGLYMLEENEILKLYEDDQFPILHASTDGEKIILSIAADLKIFDPKTKTVLKLDIEFVGENREKKSRVFLKKEIHDLLFFQNPLGYYIQEKCAVHPQFGMIAFLIRGDVFCLSEKSVGFNRVRSEKGDYIYDLAFSENKIFALSSNDRGVSLEIRDFKGGGETCYLGGRSRTKLVVNSQGTKVATISSQQELLIFDVETKKETLIDKNIPFDSGKEGMAFSSDGKWIAYSVQKTNLFRKLKVYDLENGACYPITASEVDGFNPVWHPKQACLYFLSRNTRFHIKLDNPEKSHLKTVAFPYLMGVSFNGENPFKFLEIKDRLELSPSLFTKKTFNRTPFLPAQKLIGTEKGIILIGNGANFLSFEGNKLEEGDYDFSDAYFSTTSSKGVVIKNGEFCWADFSSSFKGGVDEEMIIPGQTIFFDAKKEFENLFHNVHRTYKSYFYNQKLKEDFWSNLREKYLPLLDRVYNKKDLILVLSMMLAELNTLHIFIVDLTVPVNYTLKSATLPLELEYDVEKQGFKIIKALEIDPLIDTSHVLDPYKDFKKGSFITSINGEQVVGTCGFEAQLYGSYGASVQFELKSANGEQVVAQAKPIGVETLSRLRLYDWAYANRTEIDKKSKGTVGYIYLSEMSFKTYELFTQLYNSMVDKEGIIIDLRYNYGGNTSEAMIDEILTATDFIHEFHGVESCFERNAKAPKLVILCNQQTSSDGEFFITKLKRVHQATVIGTKTWGGGIGICPSISILPGCSLLVTLPAHASYLKESTTPIVERDGAGPIDIYLDISPRESFEKKDLQLAKALEILLDSKYEEPS
jgi:tricorn protease